MDEPYKHLDPRVSGDAPILIRWQRSKEIRATLALLKRDFSASREYQATQLDEADRLEKEAALLYSMRTEDLSIEFEV